ncbi:MAG: hypothetical protein JXQ29_03740 [Planctomycetes bacterium]|nr:hypothetical protein [Planctomycetota bacterium]
MEAPVCPRVLLLAVALAVPAGGSARAQTPAAPAAAEVRQWIADYFAAAPPARAELARRLDAVPPLSATDATRWLAQIKTAMARQLLAEARRLNGADFRDFKRGGVFRVAAAGVTMKYHYRRGTKRGPNGYPLYLNFHGGGSDPAVNDSAWEQAKGRYSVAGSLIAPRATQDVALSWAVPEMWPLVDRLLAECFLLRDVDPDRVYVLGYSMGGWGALLMGPAMADRWAAVGASAGGEHVDRAHPENLRNTPMILQIGTADHAFRRYELSRAYGARLEELHRADPEGYLFEYREHPGAGHGISDANTPRWLARFTRDPYPRKVVWKPVDATGGHVRTFYYVALERPSGAMDIVVSRDQNLFRIERASGTNRLTLRLSDALADLDQPVVVERDGKEIFRATVARRLATLLETLAARGDARLVFPAQIALAW